MRSLLSLPLVLALALASAIAAPDPRNIATGLPIPDESYCDQPYIVRTSDGHWLCVLTTSGGREGAQGQHVISTRSADQGKTWSKPVLLEPPGTPENSYAVLLKAQTGRIYCFYTFNADNVREVLRDDGTSLEKRVDQLGQFVFRYTDDGGLSWSEKRYVVPVREFKIDRENRTGGKVWFFWNVGRPLVASDGSAYVPVHKIANWNAKTFIGQSEGAFVHSANILTEADPEKITWETLPDGDVGLRTPQPGGGGVAEEHSLVELSDGTIYTVYRSIDGHPVSAYSQDKGHTWTPPAYATYTPGGRKIKHSRAANFAWKCANGQFLYWFHNHGGRSYDDRNPAWLSAGREIDTPEGKRLEWSQPEIALYDDDPFIRMSYPDLVEENGAFFITETNKSLGRVHRIAPALTAGLFGQFKNGAVASDGLILELPAAGSAMPRETQMPGLPPLVVRDGGQLDHRGQDTRAGFTVDLRVKLDSIAAGQTLLDSRTPDGRGLVLTTDAGGALRLTFSDGRTEATWASDAGLLTAGKSHHISLIVDGGPKLILFVIDGTLCDGGTQRQFGFGRYSPHLQNANGAAKLLISPIVQNLRLYNRPLRVSEAVGNWRSTP